MKFIDIDTLRAISPRTFQKTAPYPWVNPQGFLTDSAFETLQATLPPVEMFVTRFGTQRDFGQKGHDRYSLEYSENLDIAPEWHQFVAELKGNEYTNWTKKLLKTWALKLSFHWHNTPNRSEETPQCESRGKQGSQIFYFNTAEDWDPAWGGETVVLDDEKKFTSRSAHQFQEFASATSAETLGNRSLIFQRTEHAWHGVREISCPEDKLRKVFIVVYERVRPLKTLRSKLREKLSG